MLKFVFGVLFGAALAVGYVRYEIELPAVLQLSDKLRGNLVTSSVEGDLFDLEADMEKRRRALEIYFANRPQQAVETDQRFGHPFLQSLYRQRAIREARLLRGQWDAFDRALEQPNLRAALERKHATSDTDNLKRRMLAEALQKSYPFLARWLQQQAEPTGPALLLETVKRIGVLPVVAP